MKAGLSIEDVKRLANTIKACLGGFIVGYVSSDEAC